MSSNGCR